MKTTGVMKRLSLGLITAGWLLLAGSGAEGGAFQDALVGYWTFDGYTVTSNNPAGMAQAHASSLGTEGYFNDLSGNGQLAFGADVSIGNTVPYAPTGGKFGGAFYSKSPTNAADYGCLATVSNTAAITFSQEDFTISFWQKSKYRIGSAATWQAGQGRSIFFAKAPYITDASTKGFALYISPDYARLRLLANNSGNSLGVILSTVLTYPVYPPNLAPDSGAWVYRTLTGKYVPATDSYTVTVYDNGAAVGTTVTVTNSIIDNPGDLTFGTFWNNGGYPWQCILSWGMSTNAAVDPGEAWMDDFAMFGQAFSSNEVKTAYSLGTHADLLYPMSNVIQLLDLHLAGSGSVILSHPTYKSLTWSYKSGLSGTPGEVQVTGVGKYAVVIDGAAGTGVTGMPPPKGTVITIQ